MEWLEVSVQVEAEVAEAVAEVFARYAPQGVAIDLGQDGQTVTVKAYLPVDEHLEERKRKVNEALGHLNHIWPVIPEAKFTPIAERDWTAEWKESIPVLHIGQRIVIKPSWRDYTPAPGEVILEMDPGLAFGTGLHPTTQLCLRALETELQPGMRVLDMGTGTGILALAAAKLGAASILAVDNNQDAVVVTRRNARANKVSHLIRAVYGSLDAVSGTYHLILANILAPVIIAMTKQGLTARLQRNGVLIASGILEEQTAEVRAALEQAGLQVTEQLQQGDWVALLARRGNLSAPHPTL